MAPSGLSIGTLWSEHWHSGIYENYPGYPENVSTTKTVQSADGNYWAKIALVVSVYEYEYEAHLGGVDAVYFRVALYFDSFVDEGLYPEVAERVTFLIEKDTSGSNLGDQAIEVQVHDPNIFPGISQGRGLNQDTPLTDSQPEDLEWWALKALAFAVGLFVEPVGVAMGLIDVATAYAPGDGVDFDNAGWNENTAYSWWFNPGYSIGTENPVRQYAFNTIGWFQKVVDPDTYYGIKVRAIVELPNPNKFGISPSYIYMPPVYLQIYNSGTGGCPYVYTWNGTDYVIDNNILGDSEVSNGSDVEDFYKLEQSMVPFYSGTRRSVYSLLLGEFENEHSYLDKVRLYAVNHDPDVNIAVTHDGQILTYTNPNSPTSAVDNYGYDWLPSLVEEDDAYYRGFPDDFLLLDFGSLDVSHGAKLVLRANFDWKKDTCIHVQVLNETGGWTDVEVLRTREHWSTLIVDLDGYLPNPDGTLKMRLYFTGIHKIDYVGLDTTPQADITVLKRVAVRATHSTAGDVTPKLLLDDQVYAELLPGEQIELKFILSNNDEEARTFITYIEGHYETIP